MNTSALIASSLLLAGATTGVAAALTSVQVETPTVAPAAMTDIVSGVIDEVDLENSWFMLRLDENRAWAEPHTMKITCNDKTAYTLDGEEASMEEALRTGHDASVTHDDGVALKVAAKTPKTPS